MELHGIVCGQGHAQTFVQELSERIFGVFQEQTVVAEWRHGNRHLGQVVQVLQHRALREHEVAVAHTVCTEVGNEFCH